MPTAGCCGASPPRAAGSRGGRWQLGDANTTDWTAAGPGGQAEVTRRGTSASKGQSTLDADVVAAALLPLGTISTAELFRYVRHLTVNEQASQRYEIQFWKRALYRSPAW